MSELISSCCEDTGLCPECHEHCEFERELSDAPETDMQHAIDAEYVPTWEEIAMAYKAEKESLERQFNALRDVLSNLALYLSSGSGDDNTTPAQFDQRIRWGIDELIKPLVIERDALREALDAWDRWDAAAAKANSYAVAEDHVYDHLEWEPLDRWADECQAEFLTKRESARAPFSTTK